MTELDKAGQPAKEYEYRAWNPKTRDAIMLEAPELIRFHTDYKLQKRDNDGNWADATAPTDDAHQEDIQK